MLPPRQAALAPLRACLRSPPSSHRCLRRLSTAPTPASSSHAAAAAAACRPNRTRRSLPTTFARGASALADHHSSRQRQAGSAPSPSSSASLPMRSTRLIHAPSERDLQEADVEAEVLPVHEATFQMTDTAAQQLQAISGRDNNPNTALRIIVESGGCHGYQYRMELAAARELDDYHFEHPSLKPSNVYIDAISMPLVKGSTLDFATELIGSSFRITENPQAKGNGCGCGVSWELKV